MPQSTRTRARSVSSKKHDPVTPFAAPWKRRRGFMGCSIAVWKQGRQGRRQRHERVEAAPALTQLKRSGAFACYELVGGEFDMTRIAILQGHPTRGERHLCHALAEAYAQGARAAGHEVEELS